MTISRLWKRKTRSVLAFLARPETLFASPASMASRKRIPWTSAFCIGFIVAASSGGGASSGRG